MKMSPEKFRIAEIDDSERKTRVIGPNDQIVELPYLLKNYPPIIELYKVPIENGSVKYSLAKQLDSEYSFGKEYLFKIKSQYVSRVRGYQQNMWEVSGSDGMETKVYVHSEDSYNYKVGDSVKCKVRFITSERIYLTLIKKSLLIKDFEYTFFVHDVKEFPSRVELAILIVKDSKGLFYSTIGPIWQKKHREKIKEIRCVVNEKGNLEQLYQGVNHPFFEKNTLYDFTFNSETESGANKITVFGPDKSLYTISRPFIYDNRPISQGAVIRLLYKGLNRFGGIQVKFFVTFEDIIQNFRALKRITFDSFRDELGNVDEDSLISKMIRDFDNHENLWVISFCEVLRRKIEQGLKRKDYETALIFIDVLLLIEQWILNSGFLTSFSLHTRNVTSRVASQEIDSLGKMRKSLELILDKKDDAFSYELQKELANVKFSLELNSDILVQLYLYKYKKIEDTFEKTAFLKTIKLLGTKNFFRTEREAANIVLEVIEEVRNDSEKNLFYGVFINSEKRKHFYSGNPQLLEYIQLTYFNLIINIDIENTKGAFYVFLRYLRLLSLYESEEQNQLKLISAGINLSTVRVAEFIDSIKNNFSWDQDYYSFNKVMEWILPIKNKQFRNIKEIVNSFSKETYLRVRVVNNSWLGYEVMYKDDKLFLPFFNCYRPLKKGEQINVIVYLIDDESNFALTKTFVNLNDIPEKQILEVGNTVVGIVKRTEDYGVFVKLGDQDALIHKKELSNQLIVNPQDILDVGDVIEAKIISKDVEGDIVRIGLSRKDFLNEKINHEILESKCYDARITNIDEQYGIFIQLNNGHCGLIRPEEIAWNDLESIAEVYSRGDRITVQFIKTVNSKNFFSLKTIVKDPFGVTNIANKKSLGQVIGIYDFETWLTHFGMDSNAIRDSKSNKIITYCPFCYSSTGLALVNKKRFTSDRTVSTFDNNKKWRCTKCTYVWEESLRLYLNDFHCSAEFGISKLSEKEYIKIRTQVEKKDLVEYNITYVDKRKRRIDIDLNLKSFRKGNLKTQFSSIEKYAAQEFAGLYEQQAFLSNDFQKKINYLKWAKYYYGASKSAKSYYLNAYIGYITIVSDLIINDHLSSNLNDSIEKAKALITEIELQNESIEFFPTLEKIITLLKVLSNFSRTSEDSANFLLSIALTDSSNDHDYIKNLAAAVLSFNLLQQDQNKVLIESLKSKIALLIKRSLSSFADENVDRDELNRRLLIEKLISQGEDSSTEFKASLDVPVLSKSVKLGIVEETNKLQFANEEGERKRIQNRIKELSHLNISDRKLISSVNLATIKTIAAFANTNGGRLLIGVDEDENGLPSILGLEADIKKHKNKDGIILRLDEIIQKFIGNEFNAQIIKSLNFVPYKGKDLLLIDIQKSSQQLFVTIGEEKMFYIRRQASTVSLNSYEIYEYMRSKKLV